MKVGDPVVHKDEPWPDRKAVIVKVMKMNNVIVIKLDGSGERWVCKRSAVDLFVIE